LRDVLVDLAILVRTGAEALDRCDDHARIELLDALPGEAHAVERAGREVLDQHVAMPDQRLEHRLALRMLRIEGDRALVVVQHREVEAVHVRQIPKLTPRDVADPRPFHLDDVGAEPRQQLRASRSRLHMREVEDLHAVQSLPHRTPPKERCAFLASATI
jgi:hypothetical protein